MGGQVEGKDMAMRGTWKARGGERWRRDREEGQRGQGELGGTTVAGARRASH